MDHNDTDEDLLTPIHRRPRHASRVPDDIGEDIHRRMAAMRVRHLVDQHDCRQREDGTCTHPNHRRDVDFLHEMLDTLGLDHSYPAYTKADEQTWLRWVGHGPAEEQAA